MRYRKFGKIDWKGSALGFGTMRLPQLGKEMTSPINEEEAIKMIRYAIDNGINYVDTSATYNMYGSELVVGKALQDGYRRKVKLATKLSWSILKSADEFDRYFDEQLKRLQTDKIDFYLLHALTTLSWKQMKEWNAIQFVEKKIAEGKVGYLGFSFHDTYDVFKEIVDYYDNWTFCQVMYNYTDENNQAGRKGVEYAADKRLAIVVMEPLRGGLLARVPPPEVAREWGEVEKECSLVEWALDWVWNQPEISVVLSGMSTMEQVVQNVTYAERSAPNMLKDEDLALFRRVTDAYKSLAPVSCTGCNYCQPCPNGVNIPKIFELYNVKVVNKDYKAKIWYTPEFFPVESRADNCVECGECIEKCPQQIDVPEMLKKAHAELTRD